MNRGFVALLRELSTAEARFMVVAGDAARFHSRPRASGDIDVWVEPIAADAARLFRVLRAFGTPLQDLTEADLAQPDVVCRIGVPPRRIDLLTSLTVQSFDKAWADLTPGLLGGLEVPFIGGESLIRNERALGRARDPADLESLEPGTRAQLRLPASPVSRHAVVDRHGLSPSATPSPYGCRRRTACRARRRSGTTPPRPAHGARLRARSPA